MHHKWKYTEDDHSEFSEYIAIQTAAAHYKLIQENIRLENQMPSGV